jgi:hypothetical protein
MAVAATKRVISESRDWPASEAFERQRPISEAIRASEDAVEGARLRGEAQAGLAQPVTRAAQLAGDNPARLDT